MVDRLIGMSRSARVIHLRPSTQVQEFIHVPTPEGSLIAGENCGSFVQVLRSYRFIFLRSHHSLISKMSTSMAIFKRKVLSEERVSLLKVLLVL